MEAKITYSTLSANLNSAQIDIIGLFERVKAIYKAADSNCKPDDSSERELRNIQNQFKTLNNFKGEIICKKAFSIIYEGRAEKLPEINEQVNCFETALTYANEALIQAEKNKWHQPSLIKRQAIIKSKLADVLHRIGNHADANFLESDALKALNKVVREYPDYSEGYLEMASASFSKLKWSLRKILVDLNKADKLFNNPVHTKHLPDTVTELPILKSRVESMRKSINQILTIAY